MSKPTPSSNIQSPVTTFTPDMWPSRLIDMYIRTFTYMCTFSVIKKTFPPSLYQPHYHQIIRQKHYVSDWPVWMQLITSVKSIATSFPTVMLAITFISVHVTTRIVLYFVLYWKKHIFRAARVHAVTFRHIYPYHTSRTRPEWFPLF